MDGWMDGWILTTPNWTHCLYQRLYLQSFYPDTGDLRSSFEIKLYSILSIAPERKKICMVHWITNKQKKTHSSFNKKGLPKVITSIPQSLSRAIFKTHHPSHKATHLRIHPNQPFQEEGRSEFGLPYQLSHLAAGMEKPVIGVAAAPAANSTTAEPSLWEMHQIKLNDQ